MKAAISKIKIKENTDFGLHYLLHGKHIIFWWQLNKPLSRHENSKYNYWKNRVYILWELGNFSSWGKCKCIVIELDSHWMSGLLLKYSGPLKREITSLGKTVILDTSRRFRQQQASLLPSLIIYELLFSTIEKTNILINNKENTKEISMPALGCGFGGKSFICRKFPLCSHPREPERITHSLWKWYWTTGPSLVSKIILYRLDEMMTRFVEK